MGITEQLLNMDIVKGLGRLELAGGMVIARLCGGEGAGEQQPKQWEEESTRHLDVFLKNREIAQA
ncbi:MAG: hypothetical protein U0176_16495 [Bacteroidia bacterium]